MQSSEPSRNFQVLEAKGDSLAAHADSLQDSLNAQKRAWEAQEAQREAEDREQERRLSAAQERAETATERWKVVSARPEAEVTVAEVKAVADSVIASKDRIILEQETRIATLTVRNTRLNELLHRAITANHALDDVNKNLRLQVEQLKSDVRRANAKNTMGWTVAFGAITGAWVGAWARLSRLPFAQTRRQSGLEQLQ